MSSEVKSALNRAIRHDLISEAKKLVSVYGLSYCSEWCGGYNPLCIAIHMCRWNMAKFLLEVGARTNNSEADLKFTPLHLAVKVKWNDGLTKTLLDKNANVEAKDCKHQTPLHVATHAGNFEAVFLLLSRGVDCNCQDMNGKTPLFHAAAKCTDNNLGSDSSHHATTKDFFNIMSVLISHGAELNCVDVNCVNVQGETLLHLAVENDCLKVVENLIKNGANVNVVSEESVSSCYEALPDDDSFNLLSCFSPDVGLTPLHKAASGGQGFEDVAEILLKNGANVNSRSKRNRTPLHYVIIKNIRGAQGMIELLLFHGAELDAVCSQGVTPLLCAAKLGRHASAATLLQFDAVVDNSGNIGRTPLHLALESDYQATVEILLKHGADLNLKTRSGESAVALAIRSFTSKVNRYIFLGFLHDYTYYDSALSKLVCHYIKLKTAGLHLSAELRFKLPSNNFMPFHEGFKPVFKGELEEMLNQIRFEEKNSMENFESDCKEEFEKMQDQKLCRHLTVSEILKNRNQLFFRRNEILSHSMDSLDFEQFPIYGSLLKCTIREGKLWNNLLVPACYSFDSLMKSSSQLDGKNLPILSLELKEQIFSFLTSKDLKSLISSNQ